jgi:transposase, IS5 family
LEADHYYQHFTGETFFQHRAPIDPSSLSRWRGRIGEEGVEWMLTKTIEAGLASGAVKEKSLERVAVDTTVMEKNIAHPTDARLYERARVKLVALAREADLPLRQSYARLGPRLALQAGRYAHARQFRRMRKALRRLKGYVGRIRRDLRTRLGSIPEGPLRERILDALALTGRLLHQGPKDKGKLYSLHEAEVDCISKGKARVRYEFGTKVSLAATLDGGFVLGARSMPGNPYDGHTLAEALEQVEILTGRRPGLAVVDRGYRGHGVETTRVLISGTRRGLTPTLAKLLRRRSAIEPEIGHMKTDGRLARCPLKGTAGDAVFAVLCACGHNLRKILAHLRALLVAAGEVLQDLSDLGLALLSGQYTCVYDRLVYDENGAWEPRLDQGIAQYRTTMICVADASKTLVRRYPEDHVDVKNPWPMAPFAETRI